MFGEQSATKPLKKLPDYIHWVVGLFLDTVIKEFEKLTMLLDSDDSFVLHSFILFRMSKNIRMQGKKYKNKQVHLSSFIDAYFCSMYLWKSVPIPKRRSLYYKQTHKTMLCCNWIEVLISKGHSLTFSLGGFWGCYSLSLSLSQKWENKM